MLVGNGSKLTFVDYAGRPEKQLGAQQDAARHSAVGATRTSTASPRSCRRPIRGSCSSAPATHAVRIRHAAARVRSEPWRPGGLLLEGWTAIDAQNKRTTIKLSNQRYNVAVPESAFTYAEPKKRK